MTERRRIVYLADAPYIHTQRWVRHFAALGWDAHVISFRPAEIEGATVHYVDGLEAIGKARYLVHARRVRALVHELRPDLLHALHLTSYGFLAGLSGYRPSIVSVWGTDILEAPHLTPAHRWITRRALANADAVTATGLRLAEATLPFAPAGKPVSVIPYGVDLEQFVPDGRPQTRERVVVGTAGRLSPEKGLEHLLRAAALLRDEGLGVDVVIAGEGPEEEPLRRLCDELRLGDRVRFHPWVEHERLAELLREYDIFAIPSTWEGFGVSAVEAAAMGLPVVGSDVHGIPDVVLNGETGLLAPPGDPRALADAIVR
ncbi:MAG TPA: glycosyltransferase, partial [Dehalococcoidia bacterium]|nr:glycosyltransferase [Dehalococcoidia bacterium]